MIIHSVAAKPNKNRSTVIDMLAGLAAVAFQNAILASTKPLDPST